MSCHPMATDEPGSITAKVPLELDNPTMEGDSSKLASSQAAATPRDAWLGCWMEIWEAQASP